MTSPYQPAPQDPTSGQVVPPSSPASGYLSPTEPGYVLPTGPGIAPPAIYRYPASTAHASIRAAMGGLLILAAVVAGVFGNMFPYNAPAEQIINFGLILVLAGAGITLLIFAALTVNKMSRPTVPGRTSPLAIAGLSLTAIGVVGWILLSLLPTLAAWAEGDRLRYLSTSAGPFFLGFVWATGVVMAVMSLRAVGGRSRLFAALAVTFGMIMVVASVIPAIIYGLALTD